MYPNFKLEKPIRLIELFGGIGSQAMALRNLGLDFEHYRLVEFDKYPVMSYNAIHGTDFPTHDITEFKGEDLGIEETETYDYIMTYSFPCQDLSVAGNMKGMSRGSGTRSGLLWEVERLLEETEELPQVLLMENVPQVISEENLEDFHEWVRFLEDKGYQNYVQKLNAKDYGVAQNRNRAFMVSILGEYSYTFPQKMKLEKTIKDYLDDVVDEKYYIDNDKFDEILKWKAHQMPLKTTNLEPKEVVCEERTDEGIRYFENNIIGAIRTKDSGGDKRVIIKQATKQGYIECKLGGVADLSFPDSKTRRGRVQENGDVSPTLTASEGGICRIEDARYIDNINESQSFAKNKTKELYDELGYLPEMWNPYNKSVIDNLAPTLTACCDRAGSSSTVLMKQNDYRIRKLTPRECWRLMGFSDEDFHKAEQVNSNSQLYKQAGNSIVVDVLEAIFKQMMKER